LIYILAEMQLKAGRTKCVKTLRGNHIINNNIKDNQKLWIEHINIRAV